MGSFKPVITGIGVVSCFGVGKDIFWKNLETGKTCLKKIGIISDTRRCGSG